MNIVINLHAPQSTTRVKMADAYVAAGGIFILSDGRW